MYEWVLDDPENNELLMSFHEGYELTEPGGSSYYFRMNWGWSFKLKVVYHIRHELENIFLALLDYLN